MKRIITLLVLILVCVCSCVYISCGNDDDIDTNSQVVTIYEDGSTSNGSIFVSIDEKRFYLDYIEYSIVEGHLVVSGYDNLGFKGHANIMQRIKYKGNLYEVLEISGLYYCKNLTSVTIPEGIKKIHGPAFLGCTNLTTVTIPSSVECITLEAFDNCTSLTSVHCKSKNPPTIEKCFFIDDKPSKATLYVPRGSLNNYMSDFLVMYGMTVGGWAFCFKNIVEE